MDDSPRWTEIEYLPAWDEDFYDVYTAKKLCKWVMLKTLKKQYRDDPRMVDMLNKEFDARYNLSHPNIVMINDFEDVPGVGLSIICDDVYGTSLRTLLDKNELTDHQYEQLVTRLPMALEYIQQNHIAHRPLRPEGIIFTQDIGNLKLIDVGFDQRESLSRSDTDSDLRAYGEIMTEVLERTGRKDSHIASIARRAAAGKFHDVPQLEMAIGGNSGLRLAIVAAAVVLAIAVLAGYVIYHHGLK